jgi:hypothetical protein
MAIRLDEPAPQQSGLFKSPQQAPQPLPTVQVVPSQPVVPNTEQDQGTDAVSVQSEATTAEAAPQGLNIPHDQRDRNKGAGIRI